MTDKITVAENGSPEITDLMRVAVEKGADVETLERLVGLYERVADRNAAAEFTDAIRSFQEQCPPIPHDGEASFSTRSAGKMQYTYSTLNQIRLTVNPILHSLGLSYTWDSEVVDKFVRVTCEVSHTAGHSHSASFMAPVDERNNALSGAQHYAGTLTFAKRHSLIQALGITTADEDNDAAISVETITDRQYADIQDLIDSTGTDQAKFLKFFGIEKVSDLLASQYDEAMMTLRAKAE